MRIHISDEFLAIIRNHARADYPNECCGLLVGTHNSDTAVITSVHQSQNLSSNDPAKSFEIDPKLRFDIMRDLQSRNDGTDIIGHYHSHPDGPAAPSATDLSMAYESNMVWLICRVTEDDNHVVKAFRPKSDRSAFDHLELVIESA